MTSHLMSAGSAAAILAALDARDAEVWVGGGWGVDALLGEQTREHSDLDLWLDAHTIGALFVTLSELRIDRIFPWPGDRPWNFVLHDGGDLRIDLHCFESASADTVHYGPFSESQTFPRTALSGQGLIGGMTVRCERPDWAVRWHCGYPPRPIDHHDVPLLCERFDLDLPESFR
jgi:lincosamide nucleotidyltransferase A/C/D/E